MFLFLLRMKFLLTESRLKILLEKKFKLFICVLLIGILCFLKIFIISYFVLSICAFRLDCFCFGSFCFWFLLLSSSSCSCSCSSSSSSSCWDFVELDRPTGRPPGE